MTPARQLATLAGGCFWCLEAVFERLRGVERVESGYTGGTRPDPTYREVCTGATGHAEAIRVTFDPEAVSYQTLVDLFFAFHDPTTVNRQGPDTGTQYRSAIFTHSTEQDAIARATIRRLDAEGAFPAPIVTEVMAAGPWYAAEPEHQAYFRRNPGRAYCVAMITPKVTALRSRYRDLLQTSPA